MKSFDKALALTTAGWTIHVLGLAILLATNHSEVAYVAVATAISVAMIVWTRRGRRPAAFVVSLVLGAIVALQSGAYVAADLGSSPIEPIVLAVDVAWLVAGLAIAVGSVWALRALRALRASRTAVSSASADAQRSDAPIA